MKIKKWTQIRIPIELRDKIKKQAEQEKISIYDYIDYCITKNKEKHWVEKTEINWN